MNELSRRNALKRLGLAGMAAAAVYVAPKVAGLSEAEASGYKKSKKKSKKSYKKSKKSKKSYHH